MYNISIITIDVNYANVYCDLSSISEPTVRRTVDSLKINGFFWMLDV
jgi:hypothetical protein